MSSLVSAIGEGLGISKNSIRGLSTFISDVRECANRDQEELRVGREMAKIRKAFKDNPKMDGYQRKKCVAKILYIYTLGYEPDFGYAEALRLLSSRKFAEKQMGYLTLSVVLNEDHEMIPLVINSFRNDLEARPEQHICLALSAVCNIGGRTMAEALVPSVEKHLISQASEAMVRKKAAMCLVRLFTRYPDLFQAEIWRDRAKEMFQEENPGVLTAYVSFFTYAANTAPAVFKTLYRHMLRLLARAVSGTKTPESYLYYRVPTPWLSVKILRWLQIYDLPESTEESSYLIELLGKLLNGTDLVSDKVGSARNAFHMVLIEGINLVIHLQQTPELLEASSRILSLFLQEKSSNLRYLALEAYTQLAQISTAANAMVKKNQELVTSALQDPDISIRRRALDLVYGMCDKKNCKGIVNELLLFLNYLNVNIPTDFAIREELVLKIAILAEKFASQYKWYIDVMLKVITVAGDVMTNDIWFRVIKMVTNHQDVQQYATETAFLALKEDTVNETMVKVASFLCGEYGSLITKIASGPDQCRLLTQKFSLSSESTKAIILTSLLKLAAHFPEVAGGVHKVYGTFASQINPELQQRAVEYAQLLKMQDLLGKVTENLPAYNEVGDQEEVLEIRRSLRSQASMRASPSQNAFGGSPSPANTTPGSPMSANTGSPSPATSPSPNGANDTPSPASGKTTKKKKKKHHKGVVGEATDSVTSEFNQIVATATGGSPTPSMPPMNGSGAATAPVMGLAPPPVAVDTSLSPEATAEANFKKLCLLGQGVLYEDAVIQVGIKSDFAKGQGRVYIYFGNKTNAPLTNVAATIPPTTYIAIQLTEPLPTTVEPASQQRIGLALQCLAPFGSSSSLQLSLSYLAAGKSSHHKWDLPFTLTRFMDPVTIDAQKFMMHWQQVTQPSQVSIDVVHALHPINVPAISKVVQFGLRLQVLDGIDKNSNNITASGIFTCSQGTSFALARLETNAEAQMMRISIKTSNQTVTSALKALFVSALGKPAPPAASAAPSK
jgi:AP-2 complex subunit alpha